MAGEAIFIGYRRDDAGDPAGRVYDALEARFGRDRVFKDVDNIPVGVDFGLYIKSILPRCRVALILIGPRWVRGEGGKRRLDDPNDWVRIEIETALATPHLDVVPVLVNGARMPRAEDLPTSLHGLLRLNAAEVRRDPDFRNDMARLASALAVRLAPPAPRPPPPPQAVYTPHAFSSHPRTPAEPPFFERYINRLRDQTSTLADYLLFWGPAGVLWASLFVLNSSEREWGLGHLLYKQVEWTLGWLLCLVLVGGFLLVSGRVDLAESRPIRGWTLLVAALIVLIGAGAAIASVWLMGADYLQSPSEQ